MDDHLSTEQLGWVLESSPATIRDRIKAGEIDGVRLPGGFRIPRDEVLRLARERIEAEADRKVSDRQLEALIDQVITTNEGATRG